VSFGLQITNGMRNWRSGIWIVIYKPDVTQLGLHLKKITNWMASGWTSSVLQFCKPDMIFRFTNLQTGWCPPTAHPICKFL